MLHKYLEQEYENQAPEFYSNGLTCHSLSVQQMGISNCVSLFENNL